MIPDFSTLLKTYRIKAKLSQKELAEKANTTPNLISKYELGKVMPRTETIAKLAAILQAPLNEMLNSQLPKDTKPSMVSIPINGSEDSVQFPIAELKKQFLNPSDLLAAILRGNAMSPIMNSGDILLIDTSERDVSDGSIYAIRSKYSKFTQYKILTNLLDGSLRLINSNQEYENVEVRRSDIEIIGKVVWRGGFL